MVQWRRYYTIMLESKDARLMRHRLVQSAKEHGIKPVAREFLCSPNTVRKWLRRFNGTLNSLQSISRRPHRSPNKLSRKQEKEIIRAKKNLISYGAARLKREMQLPYSEKAIRRVCREQKLVRKWRRKKQETKRLLRDIKRNGQHGSRYPPTRNTSLICRNTGYRQGCINFHGINTLHATFQQEHCFFHSQMSCPSLMPHYLRNV